MTEKCRVRNLPLPAWNHKDGAFVTTFRKVERWLAQLRSKDLIEFRGVPKTGGYFARKPRGCIMNAQQTESLKSNEREQGEFKSPFNARRSSLYREADDLARPSGGTVRWKQQLQNFDKAMEHLETAWGLPEEDLARIRTVLAGNPRIRSALLFGSRAKRTFRRGSDIDLALVGEDLSREDILDISLSLNEETPLPYRFDIIDRGHLENRELAAHIDRVGQELYVRMPSSSQQERENEGKTA